MKRSCLFRGKCDNPELILQDLKVFACKWSLSVLQCLDAVEGSEDEVNELVNRY